MVPTVAPAGGGKADDNPAAVAGSATVKRDPSGATIDLEVKGLDASKYHVYVINSVNRASKTTSFDGPRFRGTFKVPVATSSAFMIIVSRDANLTTLPARSRVVLYSSPSTLKRVSKPQ
jgi:hypothetical protein